MAQYTSTAPTPAAGSQQPDQQPTAQHKRVYQACIPCRRRKVRCDLGSVDNPHDPPCVRCRRESKECFFSATRRKRKHEDGEGSDVDEYIVRNGRKKIFPHESTPPQVEPRRIYSDTPLTPGGSQGRSQPLRRPDGSVRSGSMGLRDREYIPDGDDNQQMENPDAQIVMRRGVYGSHDALDLLYKAATDTDRFVHAASTINKLQAADRNSPMTMALSNTREDIRTSGVMVPPRQASEDVADKKRPRQHFTPGRMEQPIDPDLGKQDLSAQPGYEEAIRAWTRFRFVRAGWFTAQEAIEYID